MLTWKVCIFAMRNWVVGELTMTANKASISWAVKSRQWTVLPREIITRRLHSFFSDNLEEKHTVCKLLFSLSLNNKISLGDFPLSKTIIDPSPFCIAESATCNCKVGMWSKINAENLAEHLDILFCTKLHNPEATGKSAKKTATKMKAKSTRGLP